MSFPGKAMRCKSITRATLRVEKKLSRRPLQLCRTATMLALMGLAFCLHANSENVKVIYSFMGGNDGAYPTGGIVRSSDSLYGVTINGGAFNQGNVYKLTAPKNPGGIWIENVLYTFSGGIDGGIPYGEPTLDRSGVIYGVTEIGGEFGKGTVYSVAPPHVPGGSWTETVLYSFRGGKDGETPWLNLILNGSGALYGVTA